MSPAKMKDPKSFIQNKPPPIPSHQGLRIQARSDSHYNCETPGREEVFLNNYERRQRQRSEQGYNSANWKPYQMLGEPMLLDDRKLILSALGQIDENSLDDSSGSSDEDGDDGKDKEKKENKIGTPDDEGKDPARKFIVRRSSKTRKSLAKEVTTGRKMVNYSKLGHGVFNMIREQDEERLNAEEILRRQKEERRRTEWQPPTIESDDDDETDEELAKDEDLSMFMNEDQSSELRKEVSFLGISSTTESEIPTDDTQSRTAESLAPTAASSSKLSAPSLLTPGGPTPTPARTGSGRKKKKKRRNLEDARPYTPCRTNISLELYDDRPNRTALFRQLCALNWILEAISLIADRPNYQTQRMMELLWVRIRTALFRQLCALNWILEAMITEPPIAMEPIIKCWNIKYRELKQNTFCKTTVRRQKNDKNLDTRWNSFVTNPGAGHLQESPRPQSQRAKGKISTFGPNLTASSAALMSSNRLRKMSAQSGIMRRSAMSGSIASALSRDGDGSASRRGSASASRRGTASSRQDGSPVRRESAASKRDSSPRRAGDGKELSKGLTKFLGEIYESASNQGAQPIDEAEGSPKEPRSPRDRSPSLSDVSAALESRQGSSNKRSTGTPKSRPTLSAKQLEERAKQVAKPPEQQVSRWVTNTTLKLHRTKSTPNIDPKVGFPSHKLKHLPTNLRDKFADVTEDNALTLHDKLEGLEKRRLWRSEEKFRAIRTGLHISAQLELLKRAGLEPEDVSEEDKQRMKIDDDCKWFQELMRHLPPDIMTNRQCSAVVDKLQSMGKIESRKVTPQKFLDVLALLKPWELCAPDISAAVEFVRDKVVGMTVEDFEGWYRSEVPGISRSQSVPLF